MLKPRIKVFVIRKTDFAPFDPFFLSSPLYFALWNLVCIVGGCQFVKGFVAIHPISSLVQFSFVYDIYLWRLSLTSRLVPVLVKFIKTAKREFLSDLLDFVLKLEEDYLKEFSKFDKVTLLCFLRFTFNLCCRTSWIPKPPCIGVNP